MIQIFDNIQKINMRNKNKLIAYLCVVVKGFSSFLFSFSFTFFFKIKITFIMPDTYIIWSRVSLFAFYFFFILFSSCLKGVWMRLGKWDASACRLTKIRWTASPVLYNKDKKRFERNRNIHAGHWHLVRDEIAHCVLSTFLFFY